MNNKTELGEKFGIFKSIRVLFTPEIIKPPAWEGKCHCCQKRVIADYIPQNPETTECIGCATGLSEAGKQRKEDRRQIDLYKKAMKEYEEEKSNSEK